MKIKLEDKQNIEKRFRDMDYEYKKWEPAFKDLVEYINQTRGCFDDLPNRGRMIDHKTILDGHATQSSKILASGMQSGMTSPTRPWLRLKIKNKFLMRNTKVRAWLDDLTEVISDVMAGSNLYSAFYNMYEEVGDFGTAASIILEDFDDVIRLKTFTIGEYRLGTNNKGQIDTFARQFNMTVKQIVDEFGLGNCPVQVKVKYENKRLDDWYKVYHLIEPNKNLKEGALGMRGMPYRSIYWMDNSADEVLKIKGFEEFPVIAPRWDTITTDSIYGYGPGWHLLGNVKQLQKTHLDKLLAQEKSHNPPMQKDASVEGYVNLLPGGVTPTSATVPNGGLRPAYQINANLDSFLEIINELKASINKDFYVDLFLMMVSFDKSNMTATEVAERQQEKLLMMGPVLEKLQKEMLEPTIKRIFGILERRGMIPEAPKEMQGQDIEIEYVSILAQAQKAVGTDSISRVIGFVNGVLPIKQDAADVINIDDSIREVAYLEGMPQRLLNEQVAIDAIRQNRQRVAEQAQRMEMMAKGAEAAKKASQAKVDDNNALTAMTQGQ